MLEFREIGKEDLTLELFETFQRHQVVTDCFRREGGQWVIRRAPFVDQWGHEEYIFLVKCLKNTIEQGGVVFGCFQEGGLKGFASVEGTPMGSRGQYLDLTSLHVSEEMRGQGIGKVLLYMAVTWAGKQGAEKLYISSHSAVETQRFYEAMGCVDALEPDEGHMAREPYDRQLELELVNAFPMSCCCGQCSEQDPGQCSKQNTGRCCEQDPGQCSEQDPDQCSKQDPGQCCEQDSGQCCEQDSGQCFETCSGQCSGCSAAQECKHTAEKVCNTKADQEER